MSEIEELKKLRWVEDAEAEGNGFKVRTKKGSLRTYLTHTIRHGGSGWDNAWMGGAPLPENKLLLLPQYWIHLGTAQAAYPFRLSLVEEPQTKEDMIGMYPQYALLVRREEWNVPHAPCYGYSDNPELGVMAEYRLTKTWAERANSAAMYLQGAIPHGSGGHEYYVTSFAYRLGLIGEEYVEGEIKESSMDEEIREYPDEEGEWEDD